MNWIVLLLTAIIPLAAEQLNPYFTYNEEDLRLLKGLKSEQKPTAAQLTKWDGVLEELIAKKPLEDGDDARLTAYLYVAQNDFAALSQKQNGEIIGSFGPVSEGVLRLFYPRYQPTENAQDDQYTMALSMVVMEKVRDRFIEDQSGLRRSRIMRGPVYWQGDYPYFGQKIASYKPWKLKSCNEFRCEKLSVVDDNFWNEQIAEVKEKMKDLTPEKKKAIDFWVTGDWITISNDYMEKQNVPLDKRLAARAAVAIAVEDALIGAFDSKYAYCIRRPAMIDESLQTVIPAPNHPSYPSGHSTVSAAVEGVLSHYFPEDKEQWARLSEEAGMSRIWAGIHYPVDHSAGKKLGKHVAESTLSR